MKRRSRKFSKRPRKTRGRKIKTASGRNPGRIGFRLS